MENKLYQKWISSSLIFLLVLFQTLPGYSQQVIANFTMLAEEETSPHARTISLEEYDQKQEEERLRSEALFVREVTASTSDFMLGEESIRESEVEEVEEEVRVPYELERYSVEEALDLFRPEYASAVVLENVEEEDVLSLLNLPFEVGIAVIHGEIVMFSSGNESEIRVLGPANTLLNEADLIIHTHPRNHAVDQPSGMDVQLAGQNTEYVISPSGVYGYNHQGLINGGVPSDYKSIVEVIKQAKERTAAESALARSALNGFIHSMDMYNEASIVEQMLFRSGGVLLPNSALNSSNLTPLPNSPQPGLIGGAGAGSSVSQLNQSVTLNYNLSAANSFSGIAVNYDDFGTSAIETQSLTGLSSLVFGIQSDTFQVKVEFIDINNVRDVFILNGVTSSQQFYELKLNQVAPNFDLTQVRAINFVVDRNNALPANYVGALVLQSNQLDLTGVQLSDPNLSSSNVGSLPNFPDPVLIGSNHLPGSSLNQQSSSQVTMNYDISSNNNAFAALLINYDDFGTPGIETQNLSALAPIVLGLTGPQGAIIKIVVEDQNGNKDSIPLGPLSSTEQFFRIDLSTLMGLDLSQIQNLSFVIDRFGAEPGVSNPTANRIGSIGLRLGGLSFTSSVQPDPLLTENDLTSFPNSPEAFLVGGSSVDSSFALVSNTRVDLQYDVTSPNSYSGAGFTFDDFTTDDNDPNTTTDIETQAIMSDLVFGLRGQAGDEVIIEVQDIQGNVGRVVLSGITTAEQFYRIPLSVFSGSNAIDLTQVRFINFIVNSSVVTSPTGVLRVRATGFQQPTLSAQNQAIRQEIISDHLSFFQSGIGIDPVSHFPYDNIDDSGNQSLFTQPTAIGYYLQILSDTANGQLLNASQSTSQALTEASQVMTHLLQAQSDPNIGFNGFLPFMNLTPGGVTASTTNYGLGDNANLAQSLAAFIGGLERGTFSAQDQIVVNNLITQSELFLSNMAPGFSFFIHPTFNVFQNAYDTNTGQFNSFVDRLGDEFRAAVAFVVSFYGIQQSVWDNLVITTRNYTDRNGNTIENFVPFDGGAFQMFWPLLRTNEENIIEILPALRNYLYTQADFSFRNNIPGFVSASSIPEGGYLGLQGVPDASELHSLDPNALTFDIGSVYALASAYAIDPAFVLSWLDSFRNQLSGVFKGQYGFIDSARSGTEFSRSFYAIDQSSVVLGLSNAGGDDFDTFLANRNLTNTYASLYEQLIIPVTPQTNTLPSPPTIPDRSFTVLNNFASEGNTGTFPFQATDITGLQINYTNQVNREGHFWVLDQTHDAAGETLEIQYTATTTPGEIEIELVDAQNNVLGIFPITIPAGNGIQKSSIQIPSNPIYRDVAQVRVLVNPAVTGINSADLKLHQLTFKLFGSISQIAPDASLSVADVTSLLGAPEVIVTGGSATGTSINQTSSQDVVLTLNNIFQSSYGGATFSFDNLGTFPVETQDLSGGLVLGLSSPNQTQVNIEFQDVNDIKRIFTFTQMSPMQQFWKISANDLIRAGFDPSQVKAIHIIGDQTGAATIEIKTGGLKFIPQISPDTTPAVVTNLLTQAQPTLTGGSVAGATIAVTSSSSALVSGVNNFPGQYYGFTANIDNGATTAVEVTDLSAGLVLGLSSPQAAGVNPLSLQIEDSSGKRVELLLTNISTTLQTYSISSSLLASLGLDLLNIVRISVVNDRIGISSVAVQLGNLAQPAMLNTLLPDPAIMSMFTLPRPRVGTTGGSAVGTVVTQISLDQVTVSANNQNAGDYGGAEFNFDNPTTMGVTESANLASQDVILGINSPTLNEVRLELSDVSGNKVTILLTGVTATTQYWKLNPQAIFSSGVDLNKITDLQFVTDQPGTNTMNIVVGGLSPETAVLALPPDPSQTGFFTLPNPRIGTTGGSSVGTTVNQPSLDEVNVTTNNQNTGDFGGAEFNFDDPTTIGVTETANLSAQSVMFGLDSPTLSEVRLEIADVNGNKVTILLTNVSGSTQYWTLDPQVVFSSGVDLNQIASLQFVTGQSGVHNINIRVAGLSPETAVIALPPDPNRNRPFNLASPRLGTTGGSATGTNVNRISSGEFSVTTNNQNSGDFGGAELNFDDPATGGVTETANLSAKSVIFGINSSTLSEVRLEITDVNGNRVNILLTGILAGTQYWILDPTIVFAAGVNLNQILSLQLVSNIPGAHVFNVLVNGIL